jgi:hypothetical protein
MQMNAKGNLSMIDFVASPNELNWGAAFYTWLKPIALIRF